jgi:MFS family permease
MAETLSPYRLGKARDLYNIFNVINSISWQFLTGNIITLFALRLGANSTYVGTINAVIYLAYFFLPFGKILAKHFSMVKIYSVAWGSRSIGMIPLLFAPIAFASGKIELALGATLLGVTIFHVVRGAGMIANNPILDHLSQGPDRGSYLTQVQIVQSAVSMFGGFIIAVLLGRDPPLFIYSIIMAVGIGCGFFSGIIASKIPGPEKEEDSKRIKIIEVFKEAIVQPPLRRFIIILIAVALVSGVSRTFIVVYARDIFGESDGMVSLYAVFGGLGYLMVGLLIKFLVDRIGAKPIFSVCVIIGLISILPVIFFPVAMGDNFSSVTLFLSFIFFLLNFSWLGAEGIMQTYFMGLVPSEKMMDMGMVYFFCFGLAGAGGTFLSGVLLDFITAISSSSVISFKILFIVLAIITALALLIMRRLTPLGALPLKGALEVIFSIRDLKAISLLDKLEKSSDSGEEEAILEALYNVPSNLAIKGLLDRAKSPKLSVRMESIRAIDALPVLSEEAERALMDDIIYNPYTTAYRSARTLGNHAVFQATPLLRELAVSSDYMLAGEAVIALAKLNDIAFKPQIEEIILKTQNPRLKMAGVEAIGVYGSKDSLPLLLDIIRGSDPPPYLRDEIVLAMANILELQNKFYPLLIRLLADRSLANALAMDEAESAYEHYMSVRSRKLSKKDPNLVKLNNQAKVLQAAVADYIESSNGTKIYKWIMELPENLVDGIVQMVLAEAVLDDELLTYNRLRLLIVHWVAQQLRLWADKFKK